MSRFLRLSACAAAMLALAVLACLLLRDDEKTASGGHEVSGRLVGTLDGAAHDGKNAVSRAVPVKKEAEASAARTGERAGAAKVKVLELARAAAENRAQREAAPAASAPASPEGLEGSKSPVEAEALALLMSAGGEPKAPAVKPESAQKAASQGSAKPAVKEVEKPQPAAAKAEPEKPLPEVKKPAVKKAEAEKAAPRKAEVRKAEARKPQSAKLRVSAVEAALAAARSGRLAPVEDILMEDDPAKTYDRVVTSARFSMKGSLIKLTLRGNSPMIGHFYVLEGPDRVVLDLAGNWKIDVPKVPSNRLIGAVRVGQHEDKTRLVFDMKTVGKAALVPLNRNALELRIQ
ncbi:MAG: AMIN domain-containing protein [Mailhella sp.]|nr:AMIN domain-containing protein [Mailhella sp.]